MVSQKAFAGLDKIISARGEKTSIGFGAQVRSPEDRRVVEVLRDLEPEDLVKFGLIRTRLPVMLATVDLRTGLFAINRTHVPIPADAPRKREAPLRLLYEQRHELDMNRGHHKVTYRIGWECGDKWLALDLYTAPDKITLRGSYERTARPELAAALIG